MKPSRHTVFTILVVGIGLTLCASDIFAQRGGRQRGGRGADGRQGGARGGGIQALLMRDDVRNELGLVDEQVEQIEMLNEGRRRQGREGNDQRSEMEGLPEEERRERRRELREERETETKAKIEEILLPDQLQRLNELSVRYMSQRGGRGMINGSIAEKLGITDEQKEQIEERAQELQQELNEKMAELRREMQEKLLAELTPEQQDAYRKLAGEEFEFEQQRRERPEGDRQRPGRGGQEGRRGGDRGERDSNRTDF